jgi:hypothetical protein
MERWATGFMVQCANGFGEISPVSRQPKRRAPGGVQRLNLAQFGSGSGGKQALLCGVGAVLFTDAKDLADALLVCMRGNDSENASR